jgi:Fic family protein
MTDKTAGENLVTKVMTFKSGNVPFSGHFQRDEIMGQLIRFETLFHALAALPIVPALAAQLDTDLIRRSIFGTAAIEGNPLSEERVGELLAEPPGGVRERAEQEIVNLKKAYGLLSTPLAGGVPHPLLVTEEFVKQLNGLITASIRHELHLPGMYRNHRVEVGNADHGGVYVPPKIRADIEALMAAFVEWINSEAMLKESCVVRAALAHYHLALIHPFGDGNGRTARLLEVAIMTQGGYKYVPAMMSNYYYRNVDDYYIAFRESEKGESADITPFLKFFSNILIMAIEDIQTRIHYWIRVTALRDFYRYSREKRTLTQRQFDLLNLLLPSLERTFTLKDLHLDPLFAPLYRRVTERTAYRDIQRLEVLRMILPGEKGYRLNPFALG